MGPISRAYHGQTIWLPAIDPIPSPVQCGRPLHFRIDHCTWEQTDSFFVSLSSSPYLFLTAFHPVADTGSIFLPDTIHTEHLGSLIRVICSSTLQRDTLITNAFDILPCEISGARNPTENMPIEFHLWQNHPNPFNATTTISYSLPKASRVTLDVFDVTGRKVRATQSAADGISEAGVHYVTFDGTGMASGIYFARLTSAEGTQTIKMMMIK